MRNYFAYKISVYVSLGHNLLYSVPLNIPLYIYIGDLDASLII